MLQKLIYPAIFTQENDGITITFPDLPGCISSAKTYEEAFLMGKEAMELYLEDFIKDLFTSAPSPSKLLDTKVNQNQCIVLIELDIKSYLRSFGNRIIKKH